MAARNPVRQLDRLREWRNRPDPAGRMTITGLVRAARRSVETRQESADTLTEAWKLIMPAALQATARPLHLRHQTLSIACASDAAWFQTDRFLRSGGRVRLAAALGTLIQRVKRVT